MYRPIWLLVASAVLTACGADNGLPSSAGSIVVRNDRLRCSCRDTGDSCSFWPGRRPPPQPLGSVAVLRGANGELFGFACEHGVLRFDGPNDAVFTSSNAL